MEDCSEMFYDASVFNQDLSSWDLSKVNDMSYMLYGASAFNQQVNTWDTSQVLDLMHLFDYCDNFQWKC